MELKDLYYRPIIHSIVFFPGIHAMELKAVIDMLSLAKTSIACESMQWNWKTITVALRQSRIRQSRIHAMELKVSLKIDINSTYQALPNPCNGIERHVEALQHTPVPQRENPCNGIERSSRASESTLATVGSRIHAMELKESLPPPSRSPPRLLLWIHAMELKGINGSGRLPRKNAAMNPCNGIERISIIWSMCFLLYSSESMQWNWKPLARPPILAYRKSLGIHTMELKVVVYGFGLLNV